MMYLGCVENCSYPYSYPIRYLSYKRAVLGVVFRSDLGIDQVPVSLV